MSKNLKTTKTTKARVKPKTKIKKSVRPRIIDSTYPDISARFKAWRNSCGLTFRDLSAKWELPTSTIQAYTTHRTTPGYTILRLLKKEYGISYEWMIDGEIPTGKAEDAIRLLQEAIQKIKSLK